MIDWKLRELLLTQNIENARQLQCALKEQLGLEISVQALHSLITKQPTQLRLQTADVLCCLLQVPLSSFLEIKPETLPINPSEIIKPYAMTKTVCHNFTDPSLFF